MIMDHIINNPCISQIFKNIMKIKSPCEDHEEFVSQENDHSNIFKIIFNKNKCTDIFRDAVIMERKSYLFG